MENVKYNFSKEAIKKGEERLTRIGGRAKSIFGIAMSMLFLGIPLLTMPNDVTSSTSSTKTIILPVENTFYANTTPPGSVFVINATVMDVIDLASWQVNLTWDPTLLNFSQIWLPPDHVFAGRAITTPSPNIKSGSVTWGCALQPGPYWTYTGTFNGTGTLCQIELKILPPSSPPPVTCNLTLANKYVDTFLLDGSGYGISFTLENGVFTFKVHDIAVTNVTVPITVVGQSNSLNISVTVVNRGDFTETFNVTAYANATAIQTKTLTLTSGNSTTLDFTWNTTGFAKGNYTLSAYASPVEGETDTADNTYIDGIVTVTIPGDVDGNFNVDIYDIVKICVAYGSKKGEPAYIPNCDINCDGKIDIYDVVIACVNYGQTIP